MPLFPFFMNIEGVTGLIVGKGKHAQEKIQRLEPFGPKLRVIPEGEFSENDLEREISGSKKYISELLNKEVDEICFPIGFFSKEVYDSCINAGYKILYSSIPGNYYDFIIYDKIKTRNLIQFYSPKIVKSVLFDNFAQK